MRRSMDVSILFVAAVVTNVGHGEAGLTAGMFAGVSFDGGQTWARASSEQRQSRRRMLRPELLV